MSAAAEPLEHIVPDDNLARRNALVLSAAQALAGGNNTVIVSTASIVGAVLAPEEARALLADPANGTPQASSPLFPAASFPIGPLPDLARVLAAVLPADGACQAEAVAAGRENRKAGEV